MFVEYLSIVLIFLYTGGYDEDFMIEKRPTEPISWAQLVAAQALYTSKAHRFAVLHVQSEDGFHWT
jgi:hypothetical protein